MNTADRTASQHLRVSRDVISHVNLIALMPFPIGGPLDYYGVSKSSHFRDIVL